MTPVTLPAEAPEMIPTVSHGHTQRMQDCESKFLRLLSKLGEATALYRELQQASQAQDHLQQMLANFAPATLERYLSCAESFVAFHLADGSCSSQVSPAILADYLYASQSSLKQDRGMHRTSPITAIKALRWWSKQCMLSELWDAMQSSIVRAENKSTTIKDVRESIPIPMALIAAWERAVCDHKSFTQSVRL